MIYSDTNCHEAIHTDDMDMKTFSNLIDIIRLIKSKVFRGNGKITLEYKGGNVLRFELDTAATNNEKLSV